jgi:hypothetical protein
MLTVRPIELYDANAFIDRLHRHHWAMKTHRFSLGCYRGARLACKPGELPIGFLDEEDTCLPT